MTTFIYLHGFNSAFSPTNEKVQILEKIGTVIGITYDTTASYSDILKFLREEISNLNLDLHQTTLVGTSLGGFWAAEIASILGIPAVIVNPCHNPTDMLRKYVGNQTNYATGETTFFSEEQCNSYGGCTTNELVFPLYLPLVLLDMGDDVIDSHQSKELFYLFPMMTWDGGSHRFDHMEEALSHIQSYINTCQVIDHME